MSGIPYIQGMRVDDNLGKFDHSKVVKERGTSQLVLESNQLVVLESNRLVAKKIVPQLF